jgi:hypothetical protein
MLMPLIDFMVAICDAVLGYKIFVSLEIVVFKFNVWEFI